MSSLSEAARLEYYLQIRGSLPEPLEPTEAHRESRLATAVEAFMALRPGNAYEALLAMQIVVCGAHAISSLRDASLNHADFNKAAIARNQAASMLREARAARRILAQEQKQRRAIEAVAATQLAATYVGSQRVAAQRVAPQPAPQPIAQPAAPSASAEPQATPPLHRVPAASNPAQPAPTPEAIAQAEAFTLDNVLAAAQIREDGGVTPQNKPLFRGVALPTDPAVMEALIRGSSPILDALNGLNQDLLNDAA